MNKIFGMIALIAIVLVGGYFAWMSVSGPELSAVQSATTTPPGNDSAITTLAVKEETNTYTVGMQYPQFGIPSIDAQITNMMDDIIVEFRGFPANPPESAVSKNELTGTFESTYIGPDIVSAKLIISQYTGGAHPNTLFTGINFDRTSGKLLLLNDVLPTIGMTIAQVSAESTKQLKARLGDVMFEEGANTNPENFSSLVVSKDKVTFIFQPYQVAAYSAGPQEVSFDRKR